MVSQHKSDDELRLLKIVLCSYVGSINSLLLNDQLDVTTTVSVKNSFHFRESCRSVQKLMQSRSN